MIAYVNLGTSEKLSKIVVLAHDRVTPSCSTFHPLGVFLQRLSLRACVKNNSSELHQTIYNDCNFVGPICMVPTVVLLVDYQHSSLLRAGTGDNAMLQIVERAHQVVLHDSPIKPPSIESQGAGPMP
jgi:hypothetical protein